MSRKHLAKKYFQKYYIFLLSTSIIVFLYACSTAKKVPNGEFLLTKNKFKYEDGKIFQNELPNYVIQKPNKKAFFIVPLRLSLYNMANTKYDSILNEYMTYPSEMSNQKLRDSLFIKYGHPEYIGKNLFWNRFLHIVGEAPVILDQSKSQASAENIRKRLVFRGYWDAKVDYKQHLDSASKKASVDYLITHKDPTNIKQYYYNIPDPKIKKLYEQGYHKSLVRSGERLDQSNLENEVKRINEQMREAGYYKFNNSNEEIYFTADTLSSRKIVPLTMDIHKDSLDTAYKKTTIGDIKVYVLDNMKNVQETTKDSLLGINFYKLDDQYKTRALWRPIILKTGEIYNQKKLDLSKRNLLAMNNFNIISYQEDLRKDNDSILDISYYLSPLPKYELKVSGDINYSQILNFGVAPAIDLTKRNLFGGGENLSTSLSGILGTVNDPKDGKKNLAYETSAQVNLYFPRILLPFKFSKLIPKSYSLTTSINLGASIQNNIGLGRINFNAGLNFFMNVNDIISHKLSLFNTQLSITRNEDKFYDYFPYDAGIRNDIFSLYSTNLYNDFLSGKISSDEVSRKIINDADFQNHLYGKNLDLFNNFRQSLMNKDRQTQDVIISSLIYNFTYNEIGKKDKHNPFYLNAKFETAGNLLSLFSTKSINGGLSVNNQQKTIFKTPYSQFIKFDFDVRKYFQFFSNHTLALRQFVGIGIPYGNSKTMPFVRSYFNGGSNDIRAWRVYSGLGPSDSQANEKLRSYAMDNIKLTTNIEYRMPFNSMFEAAAFVDAGNIWSLKDNGFGDQFKFSKFISQMGVGAGLGLRINIAFVTLRLDAAYKVYDPNKAQGERWVITDWKPLRPVLNFAFGYPF